MADQNDTRTDAPVDVEPKLRDPSVPANALVGDEAVYDGNVMEPQVDVVQEDVPAQNMADPAPPVETVPVNEMYVQTDRVITDTSDPLALQIPDAGRGTLDLPIHVLARGTYDQQVEAGTAAEVTPENSPTAQATGDGADEAMSPSTGSDPAVARADA